MLKRLQICKNICIFASKKLNVMLIIDGEPNEVTEIRNKILTEFADLQFFEDGHRYLLNRS